jgi:xanthine dehydrogenase YagR molybdenum-binding subunit
MRGPGAVPGLFAAESAMDELAIKLNMDPVEFRLLNGPEKDESNGLPFSSRHFQECLRIGADKFGWSKRIPKVSSMREGDLILGWGMAVDYVPQDDKGASGTAIPMAWDIGSNSNN